MITPQVGYKIDPTNPNQVIRDASSSVIPVSTLTSTDTPLNVQAPTPAPTPDIKNIPITTPSGATVDAKGNLTTPPALATTPASDFTKTVEDLQNKLLGKPAAEATAITAKTAGFQSSLNELNTQIKMHQANALARQEEALSRPGGTMSYASTEAQKVARTDAIEAMKLSALAQGMQGNILLAEKQAKNAVEAEFGKTIQDIATARQNILNNYDTFTAAEKKRADATLLALNEKDAFAERSKADREQSYKTAVEAAKNGLTDTSLLTQIQNSTPEKALELASPFLKEKEKPIIREFERNGRQIRQSLDPFTNKVISETDLGAKDIIAGVETVEGKASLTAYAQQYADTGSLPTPSSLKEANLTAGQVAEMAKTLPKPVGALVSTNTGVKPPTSSVSNIEEQGIIALSEIVRKTLPDLKDRFGKLTNAGITGRIGAMFYTTQNRQDYRTFRADFLSKLLLARSGAAVTEEEYARYAAMVPTEMGNSFLGGISDKATKTLNSLADSMKSTLDNKLNSEQLSIYGYSKVKINGEDRIVGESLDIGGKIYRVLPDGKLTDII